MPYLRLAITTCILAFFSHARWIKYGSDNGAGDRLGVGKEGEDAGGDGES